MEDLIPSLGAVESVHDSRTINHAELDKAGAIPTSFQVDYLGKSHKNQLKCGVCTACATDVVAEWYQQTGFLGSIEWLYKMGKVLIDNNTTEGSSIFTMLKVAQKYGIPSESLFPSNFNRSYSEFMADTVITQAILDDAAKHKIPGYAKVDVTPDKLMSAIYSSKGGIICRMSLGNTFWVAEDGTITWDSKKIDPIRPPRAVTSGHAIVMVGYDTSSGKLFCRMRNSWGDVWDLAGDCTFDFSVMAPYITEAWTIIDNVPEIIKTLDITFKKDLKLGMTDSDVLKLQQFLNNNGYIITPLGIGSKGFESNYFGNLTLKAVQKFQSDHGIPLTGFVGVLTRNAIEKVINSLIK